MANRTSRSGSQFPLFKMGVAGLLFTAVSILMLLFGVAGLAKEAEPIFVSASSEQEFPAVAFDGTNYLVVWQENRGTSWDIYGARVDVSGNVIDPTAVAISTAAGDEESPAVAFDGTNYLVVWTDSRGSDRNIYGARVAVSGDVLDSDGIEISTAVDDQYSPAVAFDGANYLVVWSDSRGTSVDIYGARVNVSGVVLDPSGRAIAVEASYQVLPAIAFNGTNYLVVWGDYRNGLEWNIYGARIETSGVVLDPDGLAISTSPSSQYGPAVASDGSRYLVVWQDIRGALYNNIYGTLVEASGNVLNPGGIAISTAAFDQYFPAVAFGDANYLVAWRDYRSGSGYDIYGARVRTSGIVLDPGGIAISTAALGQYSAAVAFDGTNYLVAWEDQRSGSDGYIYATRVSQSGTVLDPEGLTNLTLASASVTGRDGYVRLSWKVDVEVPAASFVIQRSDSPEGEFLTLDVPIFEEPSDYPVFSFYCTDYSVVAGGTYWYRIVLLSSPGQQAYGPLKVDVEAAPIEYRIYQSYPNPFNPLCTIRYEIPEPAKVSLRVFDASGSTVRTLVDGWREAGLYREVWDGKGDDGTELPSGIYFYRLKASDFAETRKIVLLR